MRSSVLILLMVNLVLSNPPSLLPSPQMDSPDADVLVLAAYNLRLGGPGNEARVVSCGLEFQNQSLLF